LSEKLLTGRLALIAGGSEGIGFASARSLQQMGSSVVLAARRPEQLEMAAEQLRRTAPRGAEVSTVILDGSDPDSINSACDRVLDVHGVPSILVNSIGSAPGGTFDSVPWDQWTSAFNTKVLSAVQLMTRLTPAMVEVGWGRIVNIAGSAGREPDPQIVVGGAANASLMVVTKAASRQLAPHGVTVNAVLPGAVATQRWEQIVANHARHNSLDLADAAESLSARIPMGRPADPGDVGSLVAWLASPLARHITGASVTIDGGQSVSV
jgi:NAD(P)-dependent dehydrogenase (short-subunit alcohol dehydrogenase family)